MTSVGAVQWRSTPNAACNCRIAGIDFETTGLDPRHNRIISAGVCVVASGHIETCWEMLVAPGQPIPRAATRINGITDELLADAPAWPQVESRLAETTDGCLVVAHNLAFDASFWAAENRRAGIQRRYRCGLCTKKLAIAAGLRRHERDLKTACGILGIAPTLRRATAGYGSTPGWHRAGYDAAATALLASSLLSGPMHVPDIHAAAACSSTGSLDAVPWSASSGTLRGGSA